MTDRKPIKRSPQLAPLSREHHDALLFIWKVRQGIKNETPVDKLRSYTLWYWKEHTKAHFFQEEKILLPYMPAGNAMAEQMKKEHDQIRELVLTIDKEADETILAQLCDLVDKHIRFEERQLFGFLESSLTQDQLNTINKELAAHPVSCAVWEDAFWVRREIDNR
jgi:hemerythrin-like domain-containing protein